MLADAHLGESHRALSSFPSPSVSGRGFDEHPGRGCLAPQRPGGAARESRAGRAARRASFAPQRSRRPSRREVVVLATCNRVEIYAQVDRFHGSVEDLTALLVERAGARRPGGRGPVALRALRRGRGRASVLGSGRARVDGGRRGPDPRSGSGRTAGRPGRRDRRARPERALPARVCGWASGRTARRGIDAAGRSLVSVALDQAAQVIGDLAQARVCIVGAGSVAALAASTVRRPVAATSRSSRGLSSTPSGSPRGDGRRRRTGRRPGRPGGRARQCRPGDLLHRCHRRRDRRRPRGGRDAAAQHAVDSRPPGAGPHRPRAAPRRDPRKPASCRA